MQLTIGKIILGESLIEIIKFPPYEEIMPRKKIL